MKALRVCLHLNIHKISKFSPSKAYLHIFISCFILDVAELMCVQLEKDAGDTDGT